MYYWYNRGPREIGILRECIYEAGYLEKRDSNNLIFTTECELNNLILISQIYTVYNYNHKFTLAEAVALYCIKKIEHKLDVGGNDAIYALLCDVHN